MTPPLSLSERLMTNLHSWLKTLEQKLLTREKVRIPSLVFKSSPPMWNDDSTSLPTNAEHAVLCREPLCNCLNLNPIFARMSHCSLFDIQITDWWRIMTMMRRINHNTRIVHFWSFSRGIGIDKNAHDSPFSLCNFFTDLTNNPELHHTFISEQFVSHHTKAVPQTDSGNPNVSFSAHCWVYFNHTWGPKTDW